MPSAMLASAMLPSGPSLKIRTFPHGVGDRVKRDAGFSDGELCRGLVGTQTSAAIEFHGNNILRERVPLIVEQSGQQEACAAPRATPPTTTSTFQWDC
jgi:hypothetical protein